MALRKGIQIALLGAPGVGKGTFAARIGPHFGIPFISTGDLVRAEIKKGSALGQEIRRINDSGQLVGDEIVLKMLLERLNHQDCQKGFLLDGFPRRVTQAQAFEKLASLDFVVNIDLREDVLIQKTTNRRVCKHCGHGYNLANIQDGDINMPPLLPKVDGICDKCTKPLEYVQRSDDKDDVVRARLETYHKETKPLIDFYSAKHLLVNFQVKRGIEDVPDLLALLDKEVKLRKK